MKLRLRDTIVGQAKNDNFVASGDTILREDFGDPTKPAGSSLKTKEKKNSYIAQAKRKVKDSINKIASKLKMQPDFIEYILFSAPINGNMIVLTASQAQMIISQGYDLDRFANALVNMTNLLGMRSDDGRNVLNGRVNGAFHGFFVPHADQLKYDENRFPTPQDVVTEKSLEDFSNSLD